MIVVDASAVLELLLGTDRGARVAARIDAPSETLHAPHLIDLEVLQVLRRYVRTRQLELDRAEACVTDFHDLGIERYPHDVMSPRIWELRDNATAYDAAYLALAEILRAPLVTLDAGLAAVPGVRARVEVLAP